MWLMSRWARKGSFKTAHQSSRPGIHNDGCIHHRHEVITLAKTTPSPIPIRNSHIPSDIEHQSSPDMGRDGPRMAYYAKLRKCLKNGPMSDGPIAANPIQIKPFPPHSKFQPAHPYKLSKVNIHLKQ